MGTEAANYMQAALLFDPNYHLARLLDLILGAGVVSSRAQHKITTFRNPPLTIPSESKPSVRIKTRGSIERSEGNDQHGIQQARLPAMQVHLLALDHVGITDSVVDLTTNATALGYSQAPVVVVNDHHRSGFNPTEIERLKLATQ
ncbi:hypothetical protein [Arthrobacter sp. N199823]|uniref:hypothetical protein n=1 Tax=Arthrobacter sp. N199823 TaxID=2058895 RepID=UPI0028006E17|nr:hypothetical protein [Arthrobacter sp. N199823]